MFPFADEPQEYFICLLFGSKWTRDSRMCTVVEYYSPLASLVSRSQLSTSIVDNNNGGVRSHGTGGDSWKRLWRLPKRGKRWLDAQVPMWSHHVSNAYMWGKSGTWIEARGLVWDYFNFVHFFIFQATFVSAHWIGVNMTIPILTPWSIPAVEIP